MYWLIVPGSPILLCQSSLQDLTSACHLSHNPSNPLKIDKVAFYQAKNSYSRDIHGIDSLEEELSATSQSLNISPEPISTMTKISLKLSINICRERQQDTPSETWGEFEQTWSLPRTEGLLQDKLNLSLRNCFCSSGMFEVGGHPYSKAPC